MPEFTMSQALVISTFLLALTHAVVRAGRTSAELVKHLIDRRWPKTPEQIAAEGIAKQAMAPIEVGRLIGVCNDAIRKHDELIELNRKDIDIILQRESTKDALLKQMGSPTLKPSIP